MSTVRWTFASVLAGLTVLPVKAESNWLLGGRWVEVDRPCFVYLDGEAVLHPPAELDLPWSPSRLTAHYSLEAQIVTIDLVAVTGESYRLVMRREGELAVDASGHRYRRCGDVTS